MLVFILSSTGRWSLWTFHDALDRGRRLFPLKMPFPFMPWPKLSKPPVPQLKLGLQRKSFKQMVAGWIKVNALSYTLLLGMLWGQSCLLVLHCNSNALGCSGWVDGLLFTSIFSAGKQKSRNCSGILSALCGNMVTDAHNSYCGMAGTLVCHTAFQNQEWQFHLLSSAVDVLTIWCTYNSFL